MKKFLSITMALALLLISPAAYAQAEQTTEIPPPVAPPLVREGDFAIKLVSALEIGTAENEVEAEAMLASAGIAPENGWISDYPVTPDIIGELQVAVAAAADAEKLLLDKDEALEALEIVSADLGLSVLADTSGDYAETQPPATPRYVEPTVVNNYYYTHGPPVVTYYPPPPAYGYLYAWVPYPFWWCAGFSFRGFFILHDFHRVSIIHPRVVVVTNHVFHRHHRRFFRVHPVKRRAGKSRRALVGRSGRRAFASAKARRAARSILLRSRDRMRSSTRLNARNSVTTTSGGSSTGRIRPARGRNTLSFNGGVGKRTQIAPQKNFKAVPKGSERSFSTPGKSEWRSSTSPSRRSRGFSGDFRGGSRGFSRKFSRNSPVGGFARSGARSGRF